MATFSAQVVDLVGAFSDETALDSFITEGANEVINAMPRAVMERVAFLLKTGISVESLTKTVIFTGFVEGAFTPDVGLLLTPRVSKMIFAIGKGAGIEKININPPKKNKTKDLINTVLQSKLDDLKLKKKDVEDIEEMEEESKGLMSREEKEDGSA